MQFEALLWLDDRKAIFPIFFREHILYITFTWNLLETFVWGNYSLKNSHLFLQIIYVSVKIRRTIENCIHASVSIQTHLLKFISC